MSEVFKLDKFANAVEEYKRKETEVKNHFLMGIVSLGKILQKQRDIWKPQGLWTRYLDAIGKSMAGANQFIRLYEYAEKHQTKLLQAGLTNWEKVNLFLSLPDELKLELLKYGDKLEDFDNEEYKNKVAEIKDEMPMDFPVAYKNIEDIIDETLATQAISEGLDILAKKLLRKVKSKTDIITNDSKQVLRAVVALRIAIAEYQDVDFSNLSPAEEKLWLDLVKSFKSQL